MQKWWWNWCVCVFVCISTWVGVRYWGHRVSGVCYGTEMDISEQEGAGQTRLFPCLEILDGVSLVCLWQTGMRQASRTTTWAETDNAECLELIVMKWLQSTVNVKCCKPAQKPHTHFWQCEISTFLFIENEYTSKTIKMWYETYSEFLCFIV